VEGPEPTHFAVGEITVSTLVDVAELLIEPTEFFPQAAGALDADPAPWYLRPPWTRDGRLIYTIQAFLVRTPSATVLVDAAVGAGKPRLRPQFDRLDTDLPGRLAGFGLRPEDVDHVVLTHLHVDHVGWATVSDGASWVPTFGRARYLIPAAEGEYWCGASGRAALSRTGDYVSDSIVPVVEAGLVDWVSGDVEVTPGVTFRQAAGHTPGCGYIELVSAGRRAVLAGDVIHHPLQLAMPDWSTRYCVDPGAAAAVRRRLLAEVADTETIFVPAHFASPSAGLVRTDGPGYRFSLLQPDG
jgi:glyoxylase-like metal-dependent hydrolase (beta-lactamase superfamily II)